MGATRPASASGQVRSLDVGVLRRLRLARDAMDREWDRPLDVAAVAARAGYSRYHFVRLFRQVYGETPGRYLSRRRIERAGDLLASANLTVTEICMLVGFTSLGTFCTRFKRQTGMTPGEGGMRWLTVGPRSQPELQIALMVPGPPSLDPESAEQLRALLAKGVLGAGAFHTDDCQAEYDRLSARGVTFVHPPEKRPYGIEAVFRDDSGNWFSLTQPFAKLDENASWG
ncbi:helix-turn-helix domain-containing protein [Actinomadura sp. 21ATH]|uniref:helix-turn-helix domain-containing protein n=1 Tax=Actinomadura sp. 21ATH TaxID=1735444 RepID=UPI0035BF6E91